MEYNRNARRYVIKNGVLVTPEGSRKADLLVSDGIISRIGPEIDPAKEQAGVIDAGGRIVTYAFADVHVHLREPGYPQKETIAAGTMAAAHGGYTCVCPMPNLDPAPDSVENIEKELEIIRRDAVVDVRPYATITMGRKGREVVDVTALKDRCSAFSDDGSGVQDDNVMREAMSLCRQNGKILAAHCEDNTLLHGGYIHKGSYAEAHGHRGICSESEWKQIERDIRLASETGCSYHVCHISTKESVELIRRAKAEGIDVTCETGPHYLVLCQDDLQEDGRFKMNPPLRNSDDRDALIEGIKDGTIDMIATDHAPHTAEEKSRGLEKSAMGITGLETSFPVLYTHLVRKGVITLERLVGLMCDNPRRRFSLGGCLKEGESADLAIFDVESSYTIEPERFFSKGHSTPFAGWTVTGECIYTIYKGNVIYEKK